VYRYEAGKVDVFAGGGTETTDGVLASKSLLVGASGIAVDKDGYVYVSERGSTDVAGGHRVRRIAPSGVITTIAGTSAPGNGGDGGPATSAQLNSPHGLTLDEAGQLYIVDQGNNRIRRISADGLIQTVIGGGTLPLNAGSLAVNVQLNAPDGIAAGPDGSLYIATKDTVLRTFVGLPKLSATDHLVPSADGRTLYRFDARGKHLETIDAVTGITELTFKYNGAGLLDTITDKNGNVTTIERESDGKPKLVKSPYGQSTLLAVNDANDAAEITDPIGRKTTITWTATTDGLIEKVDDPKQKAKTFIYDPSGRLISDTDPTGYAKTLARAEVDNGWSVAVTENKQTTTYTTAYSLDTWTRTVTHPDGTKSVVIDSGHALSRKFPDGTKEDVTFAADMSFGAQALVPYEDTVTLPSGKALTSESMRAKGMADVSNPLDVTDWLDSTTVNSRYYAAEYNRNTGTVTQTSPMGRVTTLTLDDLGRPSTMTSSGMPATEWQYDDHGRVHVVKRSASGNTRTQSYDYDSGGWVEYFTDALAEKTKYGRDAVGRLRSLQSPDQSLTYWGLDDADNVKTLTPPGHSESVFGYDSNAKLLTSVTPPAVTPANAGKLSLTYGSANQLLNITHADGRSVGFTYDSMMRLSSQKLASATISYGYSNGHLTHINRSDGVTLDQTFDGSLWTGSSWSGAITGKVKATYDKNLFLASLTVNDASTVNFTYDADGLLVGASATAGAVTVTRDVASGNVTGTTVGNTTSTQSFTEFGELGHLADTYAGASLFEQTLADRDALGRITHLTETVQGTSHDVYYTYDLSGRLATEKRDGVTTVYSYDIAGNRTSVQAGTATAVTATYDEQDRILTKGTATYTHDDHGDLKTRTDGAKGLALTYDELGNLTKAAVNDGTTTKNVEYIVDGLGRRVARRVGGTFDKAWLYRDSLRPVAEVDSAGVFTHYVYPSNSAESGAPIALIRAGVLYRVVKDHLGSVRLVVNASTGVVAQSIDYDAYGRVLNETGVGFKPFGFAGGLYDADTKLVRFGARDYDADSGRWTNKDPIGFAGQQGNLYVYVGDEPVNGVDLKGTVDVFRGLDLDLVGIVGVEVGVGVVFDTDHPLQSGIYVSGGPGSGASVGIAVQDGIVLRDIEGWGTSVDINAKLVSPVLIMDDKGINGVAGGVGPGIGVSVSTTYTTTLSPEKVIGWVKALIK
jgi:RHS repeat-associated protein